jgi:iron uptake system EfeUOB component EfeO/EfeM
LEANVDGAKAVFDLVSPLLVSVNAQLNEDLGAQFTKVQTTLDGYRTTDGFEQYSQVSEADRAKLKTSMAELSELLSQVSGSLGLQVNQ